MKPVLIQPIKEIDYPHVDKPVHFTPEFLASLTGNHKLKVHNEHHGEILTETTELFYKDGGLYAIFKDDIDTANKGFSARFNPKEMLEFDDHYEPVVCPILSVDQTSNPRNIETFLYNSSTILKNPNKLKKEDNSQNNNDETNKGNDNMTDEQKTNENEPGTDKEDLKKMGVLEYEADNFKKRNELLQEDLKNQKEKIATTQTEKEEIKEENEKLKEKLKVFEDAEKAKTEALAKELAGDNETLLETYKKLTTEELENIKSANDKHDKYVAEQFGKENPHKGVSGAAANEFNKNSKEKELSSDEKYEEYNKMFGRY